VCVCVCVCARARARTSVTCIGYDTAGQGQIIEYDPAFLSKVITLLALLVQKYKY
jgi:hypothetical protein